MSSNRLAVTLAIACALVVTGCGSDPPAPGWVRLGLGVTWVQAPTVCGEFDLGYEFEISVDGAPLPARHACNEQVVVLTGLAPGTHGLRCRLWFLGLQMGLPPIESTVTVASGSETLARCDFATVRHRLRGVWTLNGGASSCPADAAVDLQATGAPGWNMSWAPVPCTAGEAFANFPEESSATWRAHFVDMAHPYEPLLSDARVPDLNADPNLSFDLTVPWL